MAANKNRTLTVVEGRYENKKIVDDFKEVAKNRGWGFCHLVYVNSDRLARFDIDDLPLDCVVFRDLTCNNYTEAERFLQYLKNNNKVVVNANATGARATTSDKHFQQGLFLLDPVLREYALPTFEAKVVSNVLQYIKAGRVSFPIVLKNRMGTTGKDIILIKNKSDLEKQKNLKGYLFEQYVTAECDWRVFVMGGTAIGIMRKTGDINHPEDFEAWSGGRIKSLETDPDTIEILSDIACRAADVSHLEYTGVDIIRDSKTNKFHILETNFAAGWMNFVSVTHINIPDLVLDWLEERYEAKSQPIAKSVKKYINNRKKYLSRKTRQAYDDILAGKKGIIDDVKDRFRYAKSDYLYDTGTIFKKLSDAYIDLTEPKKASAKKYKDLIKEIESMPLSWAGNFIGPEVGIIEEGAILSGLYLYILGKIKEV